MTQRYFLLAFYSMPCVLAAGLYAYAYSLGGRRARLVLSLGIPEIPHLLGDFFWLFWHGKHAARRGPAVSDVFEGMAGAEGATEAGLRVPTEVSAYQAAADEEARILSGLDAIVKELETTPSWLDAFHETTAANPVYRAWVLERTGELDLAAMRAALAEGRELVHAGRS